jgi:magnesium-transporting ATPase (P-type)
MLQVVRQCYSPCPHCSFILYNCTHVLNYDSVLDTVLKVGTTIGELDSLRSGLSTDDALKRMHVIGPNTIRMRRPTCFRTIFKEFSRRFYTYQYFMVWSWVPLSYYYMAIVQFFVITIGGLVVSFFQYQNDKTLYSLTRISGEAKVLRDGQYVTIPQKELVPGDVVFVEHGLTYCDMVLVQSAGVLVDESAVTGESAPMAKTAIDPLDSKKAYDRFTHKKHTISAGTTVLESEATENLAVVTSTGSFTTKGELLRGILSYQRPLFKFDTEVKIVIIILALYAIFAFAMTVYFIKDSWIFGWFYGM